MLSINFALKLYVWCLIKVNVRLYRKMTVSKGFFVRWYASGPLKQFFPFYRIRLIKRTMHIAFPRLKISVDPDQLASDEAS